MLKTKLVLIAWLVLMISGACANAQLAVADKDQIHVKSLDFAFDGGSLLLEIESQRIGKCFILVLHPDSKVTKKNSLPTQVLLSRHKQIDRENTKFLSANEVKVLVSGLIEGSDSRSVIQSSTTAVLLAICNGLEVSKWGEDAIDDLKLGYWTSLFAKDSKNVPPLDPFE